MTAAVGGSGPAPALLSAVAGRTGRVVLVLGAGCSLEYPTDLKLASAYSVEAHTALVRDGVLAEGDCENPADLSLLASAVAAKVGGQAELVSRLPLTQFRQAVSNSGYRVAAALLREGAVSSVMTLNFDLAMSDALHWAQASEVSEIPGPGAMRHLGARSVIYLHRNVEELDYERWILRIEALETEWRDDWEDVVAARVVASPVVVFAGLGSPASVLTETARRITQAANDVDISVVDPAETAPFIQLLGVESASHVRLGWCDFMEQLGARVHAEICDGIEAACRSICEENDWQDEFAGISEIRTCVEVLGLLDTGAMRSRWLGENSGYTPDDDRRSLIADLLLGIGIIKRESAASPSLCADGLVVFVASSGIESRVLALSGLGTARWSAMEARVAQAVGRLPVHRRPRGVLVSGTLGPRGADLAPPPDLIVGESGDSILGAHASPDIVLVDELRTDPSLASRLVA